METKVRLKTGSETARQPGDATMRDPMNQFGTQVEGLFDTYDIRKCERFQVKNEASGKMVTLFRCKYAGCD